MKKNITSLLCILILLAYSSCKKYVEVEPPIGKIIGNEIYENNSGAASVLTGIYQELATGADISFGESSIGVMTGLYSDELTLNPAINDYRSLIYQNNLTNQSLYWNSIYAYIFRTNAALSGIQSSDKITEPIKSQLVGEAKFLRAFLFFYLINTYGDVPLVTTPNLEANINLGRTDKKNVYRQIITDLQDAQQMLSANYLKANLTELTTQRIRPTKSVATALLSRVYLFEQRWSEAEMAATQLIDNSVTYKLPTNLNEVFLRESTEVIWALQPTNSIGLLKSDAGYFTLNNGLTDRQPVFLSNMLYNAFETNDKRKIQWVSKSVGAPSYNFASKYKDLSDGENFSEYIVVFRLAEQYLIRAEARAQQGKIIGANSASEDLNRLRTRAGLLPTAATSLQSMLDAILHERRVELFTEWGHRWFDLKRTGKVDEIMSQVVPLKGGTWSQYKALFPISVEDIRRTPALRGHQNPGYTEM